MASGMINSIRLSVAGLALASVAGAQTPDVIVYDIGVDGGNTNDIAYYGQSGGIAAYSIATQSCNNGNGQLDWFDSGGDTRHPVISQNMFRLKDGRFEHIGQSWLKHGFCAVNEFESQCGPCQTTNCDTLGVGCADTYWATLNDGQGGRSKRFVNAADGTHQDGTPGPTGPGAIRGRLQVAVSDIDPAQNPGAEWFIEGHYVTADDHAAGEGRNNASWRRLNVIGVNNLDGGGPTNREEPAILAWVENDTGVGFQIIPHTENGFDTYFFIAYKAHEIVPGTWDYEYAIQNLNSDQSAMSFTVPIPAGVNVSNIGFHDVDYHSGDPYDGTDWPGVVAGGNLTWSTDDFNTNANANALRWGTLYNFRFQADTPPTDSRVTLGLFKPGVVPDISVNGVPVPSAGSVLATANAVTPTLGLNIDSLDTDPIVIGNSWTATLTPSGTRSLATTTAGTDVWTIYLTNSFIAPGLPFDVGTLAGLTPAPMSELHVTGGSFIGLAPIPAGQHGMAMATFSTGVPLTTTLLSLPWAAQAIVLGDVTTDGVTFEADPMFSTAVEGVVGDH